MKINTFETQNNIEDILHSLLDLKLVLEDTVKYRKDWGSCIEQKLEGILTETILFIIFAFKIVLA